MDREAFIIEIADALNMSQDEISEETLLNADNWDSVAQLAAIAAIDERFSITIPSKALAEVRSVGELLNLVERNITQQSAGAQ